MTLTVEIRAAHKEQAFIVPSEAVRETANGTPTLLTIRDGEVISQPVTLGMQAGGKVEILQGVQAGSLVVMNAAVTPGERVRPRIISDLHSEVL